MKIIFKKDTGEMVAYGTGPFTQWSDTDIYYTYTTNNEVYPGQVIYTYDGTNVIEGDPIPEHDLTGS